MMAGKRKRAQLTLPRKRKTDRRQPHDTIEDARPNESSLLSELSETPERPSLPVYGLQEDSHDSLDSASTAGESEEHLIELLSQGTLQYVNGHRVAGTSPLRYFELHCLLKDRTEEWIPEATVQRFNNAAVCTYWHAREDKDGKPVARPYGEVDPQVLKIIEYQAREDQFWVQMVGDPVFHPGIIPSIEKWQEDPNSDILFRLQPTYMPGAEVREKWPHQCEIWDASAKSQGQLKDLQVVFGHRKNCCHRKWQFEFSLLYFNEAPDRWFNESDVHSLNFVALMTYWQSSPELRKKQSNEAPVVPPIIDKIVRHRQNEDGQLLFTFQKVGESQLEDDLEERGLRDIEKLGKEEVNSYMKDVRLSAR